MAFLGQGMIAIGGGQTGVGSEAVADGAGRSAALYPSSKTRRLRRSLPTL